MRWRKSTKVVIFVVVVGTVATISLMLLANRDLVRMYGGLTQRVDSERFVPRGGPIALTDVHILSPDGERFIPGQTVSVENGVIKAISALPGQLDGVTWVDGEGRYLIPGLVDSHAHLFKSPNDLLLYIANGVTHIRELIGEEDHLEWRREIEKGRIGPDLFIASPRLGSFGAVEGRFMQWSQGYLNLTDAKEAEEAVPELHRQGYDAVKIYSQIDAETYRAVATAAHSVGMRVVGHVPWGLELTDLYSRQDEISHLEEVMNAFNREFGEFTAESAEDFLAFVEQRSSEVADDLIEHEIAVTTTLWLVQSFVRQKVELDRVLRDVELEYENPGISEWSRTAPRGLGWLPEVNRYRWPDDWDDTRRASSENYWQTYARACEVILGVFSAKGVKIMVGTDSNLPPVVPGFSLHDEFVSLNEAGMTPSQILRSTTSIPSEWLNSLAGEISVGRKANLVLLERNPLEDIRNTRSIHSVVVNGLLFDRALLDQMLEAVEDANHASRKVGIARFQG